MSNIVSDYLDISALESGRVALRRKTEDLIALARQSFKLNLVSAEDKHLKVKLDLDAAALPVSLDAGKILQVMNNLISNAIKYSPPNACIEIHVRHPGPEKVVFSVQDQGPGIPSDKRESIFEPFQREDSGGEIREKSWGLGLAIVKRIVEAHGGIVSVEGSEGSGSIFSVSLPMDPEKPLKTG
jgi:signal transduction histidine kinase